jgi:hypothetical protein
VDVKEEWFRLVLDELRKNNDKTDRLRDQFYDKIDEVETRIDQRLDQASADHQRSFETHNKLHQEHVRMNDLLEDHMRRTEAAEGRLLVIENKLEPIYNEHHTGDIIRKHAADKWKLWVKIATGIGTFAGAILAVAKILDLF